MYRLKQLFDRPARDNPARMLCLLLKVNIAYLKLVLLNEVP